MPNKKQIDTQTTQVSVHDKIILGFITMGSLAVFAGLIVSITSFQLIPISPEPTIETKPAYSDTLVILSTKSLYEMQLARKEIEISGGKIKSIVPPSTIICSLPKNSETNLKSYDFIDEVYSTEVDPQLYQDSDSSLQDGIKLWNSKFKTTATVTQTPSILDEETELSFEDEAIIPEDLPSSAEEINQKNQDYEAHWEQKKSELADQEKSLISTEGVTEADVTSSIDSAGETNFGTATGAGFYDTSLYMAGDIAVGVFFQGTGWDAATMDTAFNNLSAEINQLATTEPNANISFTFVKEVTGITPNPVPSSDDDKSTYVNDLRNIYQTHWAFMVIVDNNASTAAYLFGPVFWQKTSDIGAASRHETMHIFGAADQYYNPPANASYISPSSTWGYLNVVNANSQYNDGTGYFYGAGEGRNDIMIQPSSPITVFSRGQIGWWDSDGDGLLDPLDTAPKTSILSKTGPEAWTFNGLAVDQPIPNQFSWGGASSTIYNDVTLNTITGVKYRINGSGWILALPDDGAWDSGQEYFSISLPAMPNGSYDLEIQATNSVGNTETSFTREHFSVTNSMVNNAAPIPSIKTNIDQGVTASNFIFDAENSLDLEDGTDDLQVRWDFENDGVWDTDWITDKKTTHTYNTAGTKEVQLEIKDQNNQTNSTTQLLNVTAGVSAPIALFTTAPEHQYSNSQTFSTTLDASKSWDAEDNSSVLQVRWDFEADGTWDTTWTNNKITTHTFQLPKKLPTANLQTEGEALNVALDPSGSYLYVASSDLYTINITNPENPTLQDTDTIIGDGKDVYVSGNYAYVADNSFGLRIFDISTPSNPNYLGGAATVGARGVYTKSDYAYIADGSNGLVIINVSQPSNPNVVAISSAPDYAFDVFVDGGYAYVADQLGLQIINVATPSNPITKGRYNSPGASTGVFINGTYAYLADGVQGLRIINISNKDNPAEVGYYDTTGEALNVYVANEMAYVADRLKGLQLINVTSKTSPVLAASSDTWGDSFGVITHGSYAYVADRAGGIKIINIATPYTYQALETSQDWHIKMEIKDSSGYTSQASRTIWASTYDTPPIISNWTGSYNGSMSCSSLSAFSTTDEARDVQVSGSLAYVAAKSGGLRIIDIHDPSNLYEKGYFLPPSPAYGLYLDSHYAYLASSAAGLRIVDITKPYAPNEVGYYDTTGAALNVVVKNNIAYLADYIGGLRIIDVSNPASPIELGHYLSAGRTYDVKVSGDYAFIADQTGGLRIFNVSSPTSPTLVGNFTSSEAYGLDIAGSYVYLADGAQGLRIIDISDPTSPVQIGQAIGSIGRARKISVLNNYAYVADEYNGVWIYNISNPTNPQLADNYNGSAWSVFPTDNLIYTADKTSGLVIQSCPPARSTATCNASDADQSTTWDGMLEYVWDLNNDGAWDRYSAGSNSIDIPLLPTNGGLTCGVRDRFSATDTIINQAPILNSIGNKSVAVNNQLSFQINGTDPDAHSLVFMASDLPLGSSFNAATRTFTWTPSSAQTGQYYPTFAVNDYFGAADSETISITVTSTATCSDGTPINECSASKPQFCSNGKILDKCQRCGCPLNYCLNDDYWISYTCLMGGNCGTSQVFCYYGCNPTTRKCNINNQTKEPCRPYFDKKTWTWVPCNMD